ncbi:uncharacterized protein LOC115687867 [Syzygium oleosum]|uniref:uncharacterized protein LOC115687867 n=1 Tax=Syzygium oleosum TaxID=219896 RepID=UPI0011D227A0|nr:uncharacterized protein LOC115687867 [Syzygium oleosum]
MAAASSSSARWLSARGAAVSAAVLAAALALALRLSAPSISELAKVQIPLLWLSLLSWLEPPYVYLVINGIIATIAASSRLHANRHGEQEEVAARVISETTESSLGGGGGGGGDVFGLLPDGIVCPSPREDVAYEESGAPVGVPEAESAERSVAEEGGGDGRGDRVEEEDEEFVISRSAWAPAARRTNSPEEKTLVSSRFVQRRPSKASPEEALGVIKPKRQETLENTWKAITDGRAVPLARRRLRKSETWGEENRADLLDHQPRPAMRKSDTFKDRTNQLLASSPSPPPPSPARGGKEGGAASPSQDELNRRVEAFIRKFNEEMRLQRQDSLNQYKAMMDRGL